MDPPASPILLPTFRSSARLSSYKPNPDAFMSRGSSSSLYKLNISPPHKFASASSPNLRLEYSLSSLSISQTSPLRVRFATISSESNAASNEAQKRKAQFYAKRSLFDSGEFYAIACAEGGKGGDGQGKEGHGVSG